MCVVLVHSLPGRVRFRAIPGALADKDTASVASSLAGIRGVKELKFNIRTGSILVFYNIQITSEKVIHRMIHNIETPSPETGKAAEKQKEKLAWSYIGYQLFRIFTPSALKPLVTCISAIPFLSAGLKSLARSRLDVPVLDAAAVGASLAQKNINAASTLMMLLKTGEYLETWAKQRSHENLATALTLNIEQVWIRCEDGTERAIPYDELKQGDNIVLRSGSLIPIDGTVHEGRAMVNEASLTGEPLSHEKSTGSTIHAGSVIEEGEIIAKVRNQGKNTRYEQIISLIEDGEKAKAETEVRAYKIADKAVPFTLAAAGLTFLLTRSPRKTVSVLSVDYSCAIKLSTPLAFLAAIREGLSNGVFFKGGAPIEHFAACDTIIFDKTGTLTLSTPALARIIPYHGFTEDEALKIAAHLEEHFPHPVAKAIASEAFARNIRQNAKHTTVKYIAAHGIATEYQNKHTVIGSRHFVGEDEGFDLSVAVKDEEEASKNGYSVLYLAQEDKLIAILLIKDPVRPEAAEVITMLRHLGIKRIYLLSGDNQSTAGRIAGELSLDGGRGGLLPVDKTAIVKNLRESGCRIAFVGDGMNDSPALSAANVGIAMLDSADLARETADIRLKEASLYPLVIARLISQRVMKRINTNTQAAIILNSIFILMGLLENPLAPTTGSSRSIWLHNLTSIILSINAMRPVLKEAH